MTGWSQPRKNPVLIKTVDTKKLPIIIFRQATGDNLNLDVKYPPKIVPREADRTLMAPV